MKVEPTKSTDEWLDLGNDSKQGDSAWVKLSRLLHLLLGIIGYEKVRVIRASAQLQSIFQGLEEVLHLQR